MREEILSQLDNPPQLEKLYRSDKAGFKRAFNDLYHDIEDNHLADFWHARLNFVKDDTSWGTRKDILFVITTSLLAGVIAKLPEFLSIDEEYFYSRNVSFIIFPLLSAYFAWKHKLSTGKIASIATAMLVAVLFINFLPNVKKSDTLLLSCMHLPLFIWSILGFAYVGETRNNVDKRLSYLSYNGDLIVMTTLILIAGAVLSGVTIGLFSLIGFNIEKFYSGYIVIFGLAAAPIVGTYLTRTNPHLVGKVSPVIARIFSPLVLAMLVIYLIAMISSGKDPYNDREFLLIFNALLIGVMAIIYFSVAESGKMAKSLAEIWVIFLLSVVTVIVNGIALSAIVFRIVEWGITPNRAAVLGGNVLILINLLLVSAQLFKVTKRINTANVGKVISSYLPIYFIWTIIVTFLFPFIFGFR